MPGNGAQAPLDPKIKASLDAVENLKPDKEVRPLLASVSDADLEEAVRAARDQAQSFDAATKPINEVIDGMESLLSRQGTLQARINPTTSGSIMSGPSLNRDFTAARLRYSAQRYEVEARLNQAIAGLYELQVHKSNISAEHHHLRSQRFFFGMLGAQLAVIIAAKQRNLLWSLAAAAGLLAIAFAIYVYLKV